MMDMRRNNKRRNALTHARVNFSQSETSSFLRGGSKVKFWASTVGGGEELTENILEDFKGTLRKLEFVRCRISVFKSFQVQEVEFEIGIGRLDPMSGWIYALLSVECNAVNWIGCQNTLSAFRFI